MIEPLKDRVLIQRDESPTVTESGFVIPKNAQRKEPTGTIIAIGKATKEPLSVGQKVLLGATGGVDVDSKYCEGLERCLFVTESEIKCILGDN